MLLADCLRFMCCKLCNIQATKKVSQIVCMLATPSQMKRTEHKIVWIASRTQVPLRFSQSGVAVWTFYAALAVCEWVKLMRLRINTFCICNLVFHVRSFNSRRVFTLTMRFRQVFSRNHMVQYIFMKCSSQYFVISLACDRTQQPLSISNARNFADFTLSIPFVLMLSSFNVFIRSIEIVEVYEPLRPNRVNCIFLNE